MKKLIPVIALLLAACQPQDRYATFNGFAQGTTYSIEVRMPSDGLAGRIDAVFDEIDITFSMFNPASLVSRINRNETDATTPLFKECFDLAWAVYRHTNGFYDPTVKPLVDAWGFGPGRQQADPCVECLMEYVGMDKVRIEGGRIIKSDPRVQLDFSSIAKGLTVDRLAEMLDKEGVTDYLVNVGGEMRTRGYRPGGSLWRIQIDKPLDGLLHEREAVVSPTPSLPSIATSGNYRNWFTDESGRKRAHTIDPKTGEPALGEILSVSIAAAECAVADAWATGIMASQTLETALGLLAPGGIEYYIIYSDGDSTASVYSPDFSLQKQ